jgi:hypothetical protein
MALEAAAASVSLLAPLKHGQSSKHSIRHSKLPGRIRAPRTTVTAWPATITRPSACLTSTDSSPPRGLHCLARSCAFPSRAAQYVPSTECALPVTGSSAMPAQGAKKRLYRSWSCPSPAGAEETCEQQTLNHTLGPVQRLPREST